MKKLSIVLIASGIITTVQAQEKLNVTVTGRALFDVATYQQNAASKAQDGKMNEGVSIPDIRVGVKGTYGQWTFRGDVAYIYNTVNMRDVFMQYNFKSNNALRAGYFLVPFGLISPYGYHKKAYFDNNEAEVYTPIRRIGIGHLIYNKPFMAHYGVFADVNALTKSTDKAGAQGYTLAGRLLWRPLVADNYMLHLGLSGMHVKAESTTADKHAAISYTRRYLTTVDRRSATSLNVSDARWENKWTAELQAVYRNFQLASQFYASHIAREGKQSYDTNGFYVNVRGILLNPANYKYNLADGTVVNPDHKNLELMLGYGFLNLRDGDAYAKNQALLASGVQGLDLSTAGRMSDVSVGVSYFLNKYVTFRLAYHNVHVSNFGLPSKNVNIFQARAQYVF